jgi:hypothetical protein
MTKYDQAIRAARLRLAEAMEDAAAEALVIAEQFGKPLQTVCKDIAPDTWNALRQRAQELAKRAGQTADERARVREQETRGSNQRVAKVVLRDPDQAAKVIASLPPDAQDTLYHELKLARAGEDRTPAARSAAKAAAHAAIAPMKRAVASTHMALAIQAQEEVIDDLQAAMEDDAVTSSTFDRFEKAFNKTADLMAEIRFSLPARA